MQVPQFFGNFEIMQSHTELALPVLSGTLILGEASQGEDLCKLALQQHKKKNQQTICPKNCPLEQVFPPTADSPNPGARGPFSKYLRRNKLHVLTV